MATATLAPAPPTKPSLASRRRTRWYFGGVSSASAACVTHPLDLIKVHLQTTHGKSNSVLKVIGNVYRVQGIVGFYNGISASLLRQLTYTTVRFGIYEAGKRYIDTKSILQSLLLAALAGTLGGFVGVPTDIVNVRMQNDIKQPPENRRNYKHAIDGLIRIYRDEGARRLFTGASAAIVRGIGMTIGQNVVYDSVKRFLLKQPHFKDDIKLHFVTSTIAGAASTLLTQPLDVVKTRTMNARVGEYTGTFDVVLKTAKHGGPLAFFKGVSPALVRLVPHTILTFIIMEQLRMRYGYLPEEK